MNQLIQKLSATQSSDLYVRGKKKLIVFLWIYLLSTKKTTSIKVTLNLIWYTYGTVGTSWVI